MSLFTLRRPLRCCAALWISAYAAWAQNAPPAPRAADLSIQDAISEAIANNPALLAARLGVPAAQAAVITAGLRPNPVASASADHLDALGTGFNDINGAGPSEYAIRVDVPLERGHKRELRLDNAGYQAKIAQAKVDDAVRLLTLDVTLACIDVLEAKAKLDLANQNLKSLQGIVTLNEARVTSGATAPVELTRSRVAMLQFRTEVRTAELAVSTARVRLQTLLGRTPGAGSIDIKGELKIPVPAEALERAKIEAAAYTARPDLRAAQLDQARSQSELRLQLAQGKIDYTVGAEYRRQQGINGTGNSLGFFFSAPVPMFNRNQGEIARVEAEQQQIAKNIEALRSQISGEVVASWQEYESARSLVGEIERDLIAPSTQARDTTAYVYQAGASSLIDVLDAQRAFNETMSAYYDSLGNYRRALSRLTSAVGQEVVP